jgi:hypothetical protein
MVTADTQALLAAVARDPAAAAGPKVCVGYCMGARMALHMAGALPDEFVAAAGVHPGVLVTDGPGSPHHDLVGVRGELYFAFAENDQSATAEVVDRFRTELGRRGVRGEVERLAGTSHGFAMADLPVYDERAAEHHFQRTLELWRPNVAPEEPPGAARTRAASSGAAKSGQSRRSRAYGGCHRLSLRTFASDAPRGRAGGSPLSAKGAMTMAPLVILRPAGALPWDQGGISAVRPEEVDLA